MPPPAIVNRMVPRLPIISAEAGVAETDTTSADQHTAESRADKVMPITQDIALPVVAKDRQGKYKYSAKLNNPD